MFLRRLVPWPSIDIHGKFYGDLLRGTPPLGELNTTGVAKYSDFGPIEGYISETISDFGGRQPADDVSQIHGLGCRYFLPCRRLSSQLQSANAFDGGKLVLTTNRKSYMSFPSVPKLVTLNDLEQRNGLYYVLFQ